MNIGNEISSWKSKGNYFKVGNHKVWYFIHNPNLEHTICILHGYPTCSYDYKKILNQFPNHRIVLHDHLGFGLSDKPIDDGYLLKEQAQRALALYSFLGLNKISLFAHDYGTSVATEIIALDNETSMSINIENIILSNGSMLIDMSQLRPIQKMLKNKYLGPLVARLASYNTFEKNMKNIWSDPKGIDSDELKVTWELLKMYGGRKVLSRVTRYIDQRYVNYDRWIGALKNTKKKILILWAEDDPVAVIAMADKLEKLIRNSTKVIIDNSGHYPMIETPKKFGDEIRKFIS